ncbi:hypothetical protein [Streptomyces sodiiphilus]
MSAGFSGNYGYSLPRDWAYDQIATISVGSGDGYINIDNNIASGRDVGQGSFNPPRIGLPDTYFDGAYYLSLQHDVGAYMESIGFPESSLNRIYSHSECLESIMAEGRLMTEISHRYQMRKALIQTSAYWEMCHYDLMDLTVDAAVVYCHTATGGSTITPVRDSSAGVAQISGTVGIIAWNHCINNALAEGPILDPDVDSDLWVMWHQLNQNNDFSIATVPLIHMWGADGKPGGVNPPGGETIIRRPRLDYTDREIFEVLRRSQGWGNEAEEHAQKRMALYQIFERCNSIIRGA